MLRKLTIPLALAVVLGVASCSSGGGGKGDGVASIKIDQIPAELFFSDVIAQDQGIFAKHKLNVSTAGFQDAASQWRLVASGATEGSFGNLLATLPIIAQGQKLKIIGSVINVNTLQVYSSNASWTQVSGDWQARAKALKGKKIGVPGLGSASYNDTVAVLKGAGLDPKSDVTFINVGQAADAVAQMKAGRIDAYVSVPPIGSLFSTQKVGHVYLDWSTDLPAEYSNVVSALTVNSTWLAKNRDVAQRWLAAEAEAVDFIVNPANLQVVTKAFASSMLNGNVEAATAEMPGVIRHFKSAQAGLSVPQAPFNSALARLVTAGAVPDGKVSYASAVDNVGTGGKP